MKTAAQSISRLPRKVQDAVSDILHDGGTSRMVSDYLVAQGYPSVTTQNVSNYRLGAHKAWLEKKDRLDAIRADSEKTIQLMEYYTANGGSPAEAGLLTAAEMLTATLGKISHHELVALIAEKPEKIFAIISSLSNISHYISELKRPTSASSDSAADQEPITRGLSADAIRDIEKAAKLI